MKAKKRAIEVPLNERDIEILFKAVKKFHKEVDKLSDQTPSFMSNPFIELQDYMDDLSSHLLEYKKKHPYTPKESK